MKTHPQTISKFILSLVVFYRMICFSYQASKKYEATKIDEKISSHILQQEYVPSLSVCAANCAKNSACLSLSFGIKDRICVFHSKCPSDTAVTVSSSPGWIVMDVEVTCEAMTLDPNTCKTNTGDYIGGHGGNAFTDGFIWGGKRITAFSIHCGPPWTEYIQMKYGDVWGPPRGKTTTTFGTYINYTLNNDEYITRVTGTASHFILHINITTNQREFPQCGTPQGASSFDLSGDKLLYISGRAGSSLDCIRFHWL